MEFPQFELINFGIYDSHILHSGKTFTTERTVNYYEIELFVNEDNGISYMNGKPYFHEQPDIIGSKLGYKRFSKLHISCYYMHLFPKNNKAKTLLDNIPDHFIPGDTSEYVRIFNKMIQKNTDELYLLSAVSNLLQMIIKDSSVEGFESRVSSNKKTLLSAEKYLNHNYRPCR